MSAKILDGSSLAKTLKEQLRAEVAQLKAKTRGVPRLVNLMIGNDPSSSAYANSQKRTAEQVGIQYELKNLPENISQTQLLAEITKLNQDNAVHGIMLHKPVPSQIVYREAVNAVVPAKDIEGVHVANMGKILLGETTLVPCTAAAVMELLKSSGIAVRGKEAVIVGASEIVGKPVALLLLRERATVSVCNTGTSQSGKLPEYVGRADILVVATGKPAMVKGDWIKEGAVVIDVGINEMDGKLVGDVEFATAAKRAGFITPVPGGVGPVTVVMFMRNGLEAYKQSLVVSRS